jgi:hypothetical protein
MEEILLEISEEKLPLVVAHYGIEGAKDQAIEMCLAQYPDEEVSEENLYACLATLESGLGEMFS